MQLSVSAIGPQGTLAVAQYLHSGAQRHLTVVESQVESAANRVELTSFAVKVAEANFSRHTQSAGSMKMDGSTHPGQVDVLA